MTTVAVSTIKSPYMMVTLNWSKDADFISQSGFYHLDGARITINGASTNVWGSLIVIAGEGTSEMHQLFCQNNDNQWKSRHYRNNAWSEWEVI